MKREIDTKFYTFSQNNSGGSFVESDLLSHFVIIEATSDADALGRAENIGIYFNGVAGGQDCPCCGDRWYSQGKPTDTPQIYGEPAENYQCSFMAKPVVIHYLDGKIVQTGRLRGEVVEAK